MHFCIGTKFSELKKHEKKPTQSRCFVKTARAVATKLTGLVGKIFGGGKMKERIKTKRRRKKYKKTQTKNKM